MSRSFSQYKPFVDHVERLTQMSSSEDWRQTSMTALNGQAGMELESLVPLEDRRSVGAFFTDHKLADRLLAGVKFGRSPIIYDPACGAGDLLIASARKFKKNLTLPLTWGSWCQTLRGTDVVGQFIKATEARLLLQARMLHAECAQLLKPQSLPLRRVDSLKRVEFFQGATHVVMNPPFTLTSAPAECAWASGLVNGAALFVEQALSQLSAGGRIYAILPEVLRTGSRYAKWRDLVEKYSIISKVESVGLFPGCADVDVFLLHLVVKRRASKIAATWGTCKNRECSTPTVGERFTVMVGPVVPHRDPHAGPYCRFAHAKNIEAWKVAKVLRGRRRWRGRMEQPPFVVIRRTSRPGDKFRAIGSIVSGKTPVAVENHLLVCRPSDGDLVSCEELLIALQRPEVNAFLDGEMRLRHLTVGVVRRAPLVTEYFN